jgi:hypothetical protein
MLKCFSLLAASAAAIVSLGAGLRASTPCCVQPPRVYEIFCGSPGCFEGLFIDVCQGVQIDESGAYGYNYFVGCCTDNYQTWAFDGECEEITPVRKSPLSADARSFYVRDCLGDYALVAVDWRPDRKPSGGEP